MQSNNTALRSQRFFDLDQCVPMAPDEELRCAREYVVTKAPSLATRLVMANMRLVVTIATGYRRSHYDMRDLIQEGNLGLLRAVESYDPYRGVKLSSYAAWWIRAYILKFTIGNWQLVKVGTTQAQRKLFFSLRKEKNKLERTGGRADPRQLALALNVKEKDVATMLERFAGGETSLETPRQSRVPDAASTVGDSLKASSDLRPDIRIEASDFSQRLQHAIKIFGDTLEGREAAIFHQRVINYEPVTLAHLAAIFGVTRERARQLEERLKKRLRRYLEKAFGDAVPPPPGNERPRALRSARGDLPKTTVGAGMVTAP